MRARNQEDKNIRKNQIIDAVKSLITESNFKDIRMEDIANQAGFNKKTIYSYFKNKDELYLSLFSKSLIERFSLIDKKSKKIKTGREKIEKIAKISFDYYKTNIPALILQTYLDKSNFNFKIISPSISKEFENANKYAYDFLEKVLIQCQSENLFDNKNTNIDFLMSYFIEIIHQIIKKSILAPSFWSYKGTSKKYFETSMSLFLNGFYQDK